MGIDCNIIISNLRVLSKLKEGEKLIVEGESLKKEDREFLTGFRRSLCGSFDVKILEGTFKQAKQIYDDAFRSYAYADHYKVIEFSNKVKLYIKGSLEGIQNLSKTYKNENKLLTANKIDKLYNLYKDAFEEGEIKRETPILDDDSIDNEPKKACSIGGRVKNALKKMNIETIKTIQDRCNQSKLRRFINSNKSSHTKEFSTVTHELSSLFKEEMPVLVDIYEDLEKNRVLTQQERRNENLKSMIMTHFNPAMLDTLRKHDRKIEAESYDRKLEIPESEWQDEEILNERRIALEKAQTTLKKSISVFEFNPKNTPKIESSFKGLDDHSRKKDLDELKLALKRIRKQHTG